MSKRSDIIEPYEWTSDRRTGLVYSEVLGWIDIGHAQGIDITSLLADFRKGESSSNRSYQITYSQKMFVHKNIWDREVCTLGNEQRPFG